MALVWKRKSRHIVDGLPFEMQFARVDGGYRVRIVFDGRAPVECEQVWRTEEEALGRGFQLADAVVEESLR